jgi:aerobic-type carbon monoxide dehydrogenase small subunit (CoxS/CutS family)
MASFTVNGRVVAVRDDHAHLLAALREELGLISPKDGCAPSGQCGCCTVLLDGKAQVSCQIPLTKAEGREILTLEGVDREERDRFAQVFASTGALQCGFCTPGILMRVKALLDRKGSGLAREDAARHLGAHPAAAPAT